MKGEIGEHKYMSEKQKGKEEKEQTEGGKHILLDN